jgi:hypothetical protein
VRVTVVVLGVEAHDLQQLPHPFLPVALDLMPTVMRGLRLA